MPSGRAVTNGSAGDAGVHGDQSREIPLSNVVARGGRVANRIVEGPTRLKAVTLTANTSEAT